MSEPRGAFLLAAYQGNPFSTASAQAFPKIEVAFGSPGLLGALKCRAGCGADAVRERLVIPKRAVLQDKPAARLAEATPAFALVAMSPNPSRGVQVTCEPQILFVRNKVRIGRMHVRLRGVRRLVVK